MSTDFRFEKKVNFEELFDGRLEKFGIRENSNEGMTSDNCRCLTDGNNFLWIYGDIFVTSFTRYAPNGAPGKILAAMAETFETEIYSEYEPQYWGFETEEEWYAALDKMYEDDQAESYIEIMKHVRGELNDIRPGTNGMNRANIAKDLISQNPNLASPDRQKELMETIDKIFMEEHVVTIKLDEKDIAKARMAVTHEDDLPFV